MKKRSCLFNDGICHPFLFLKNMMTVREFPWFHIWSWFLFRHRSRYLGTYFSFVFSPTYIIFWFTSPILLLISSFIFLLWLSLDLSLIPNSLQQCDSFLLSRVLLLISSIILKNSATDHYNVYRYIEEVIVLTNFDFVKIFFHHQ